MTESFSPDNNKHQGAAAEAYSSRSLVF